MITVADVEASATGARHAHQQTPRESAEVKPTEEQDRIEAMRTAIARSMSRSKREIPHYYLGTHIDLSTMMRWLEEENENRSLERRLLPAALLLRATALALTEVPGLNGHWVDDGYRPAKEVHLGVAVSLREGGLVAPAIHNADQMSVDQIMQALRDLVSRARTWRIRSSEMSDPTVTVTNLGDRGVETAFPVIIPPQVAIIGLGKIIDQPVAVDGMVGVHPVVHATLAGDHRVTDGHRGAALLAALDRLLQEPHKL
jgi:pyruvate dehydrogenase E2 component (dihydrolipoamide acetyltransferase)